MHRFKDLKVWQKAMDITELVYLVVRHFPQEERFGLTAQLQKAAVSIPSNIAEGAGRRTNQDFSRFLDIANGSINEVETQLTIAIRLNYLVDEEICAKLLSDLDLLQKMIYRFQETLNKKTSHISHLTSHISHLTSN